MQTIQSSDNGLSLVFRLNWDRLVYLVTMAIALLTGAYVGSLF